jgi:hypothetical protein
VDDSLSSSSGETGEVEGEGEVAEDGSASGSGRPERDDRAAEVEAC